MKTFLIKRDPGIYRSSFFSHSTLLGKRLFLSFCLLFYVGASSAQESADARAANFLRQSDSLYAVITVLVTIFAGIIVFLIFQERKISRLEKQLKNKNP